MKFDIRGVAQLLILSMVMMLGFIVLYALILGVPTTKAGMVFLVLLSALSVILYCLWIKVGG